jgi:transcriptional regulator with XRE-family HTH domain
MKKPHDCEVHGAMSDETVGGIGGRVATLRKLQGLKQHQLATKAHLSVSLVKKVESGHAPASPSFTAACARALGIEVATLTGQPYEDLTADAAADRAAIPELRRALDSHDGPQVDGPVWDASVLRARLNEGQQLRRRSRYSDLAARLPLLLHHLYAHDMEAAAGSARETANALLDDGYALIHVVAYRFGYIDLAALVAERTAAVAPLSGDSLRASVAAFRRSTLQLHRGDYDLGMRAVGTALELARNQRTPEGLSVVAQLHLRQAVFAARAGRADDADAHIDEAREIVDRGVPEAPYFDVRTNRSNVDIHSVAVPVELSDGTTAVARAESIHIREDEAESSRVGHHYIDLARAWMLHGDRERALRSLVSARRISPQQTRYHPTVRETLHAIAAADRRSTDSLSGFARWAGISL